MINFLDFIKEDIEAKKTLLSTMPTINKRDIKKYNTKIDAILEKYNEYKKAVKKYIEIKSKSFDIKQDKQDIDKLTEKVNNLEHISFILNPLNTYFEKIGFDNLLYEINNYYNCDFEALNNIINQFLDKFEQAGIKVNSDDFDYTCYVNEYMKAFFDVRYNKIDNYDKLSKIFENIYWINPDIIQHIELNFRKLMKKYEKKFNDYISKLQDEVKSENKINNYEDCFNKLKEAYENLENADKEDISDIINLAKNGSIDVNNYFDNSKIRNSNYSSLSIDSLNFQDKDGMKKFYESLKKLKNNIKEYANYLKFKPLIENFKTEYEKQISISEKDKTDSNKNLKGIEVKIIEKESKLERISKRTIGGETKLFGFSNNNSIKKAKLESIKLAKELYELYKIYDQEYFKEKVLIVLNSSLTVSELLHLYYSFDYFKKVAIKKAFNITAHDEIKKYSDDFDLFAMNPNNVVVNGVSIFEDNNISQVIINKYRLDNINLTSDDLEENELNSLIEKIDFVLRVNEIENSETTVEKIWFMSQVEKINRILEKNN